MAGYIRKAAGPWLVTMMFVILMIVVGACSWQVKTGFKMTTRLFVVFRLLLRHGPCLLRDPDPRRDNRL